jgi:2-amino-4-hydroxy-6-hydroxymethyldihydropteridine diphosphokinase
MTVEHAYVSFGANLGDRKATFERSRMALDESGYLVLRTSPLYETAPWGGVEGGPFLNAVFELQCTGDPAEALRKLHKIEEQFGRQRPRANAARTCDLDLLLWSNVISASASLTLPHPRFHARKFSLVPLCDLIPDAQHPLLHKTFSRLLAECPDLLPITLYEHADVNHAG